MPRKMLDDTLIRATGWRPAISLKDGLERTYAWFLKCVKGVAAAEQH